MNPKELTPLRKLALKEADNNIRKALWVVKDYNFQMNLSEETKDLLFDVVDYIREGMDYERSNQ